MDKFLQKKKAPTVNGVQQQLENTIVANKENNKPAFNLLAKNLEGNLDDVDKVLGLAKLDEAKGEVQQIVFSSSFAPEDFRLLEVSPSLAEEIEAGKTELAFRGHLDDFPVLCTNSKTYTIKEVETSNTLLLLPELHFADKIKEEERFLKTRKVESMQTRYLELNEVKFVSLNRLRELMHENEFEWTNSETSAAVGNLYTFPDLLDVIQMSKKELEDAIARLPIIVHNGYLRMLSSEFRDRLLMELIVCLDDDDEPEITLASVSIPAFVEALKRREPERCIPLQAIHWVVEHHCYKTVKDAIETYTINEREICRSKASQLLRAAVRFELSDFENLMKQLLPDGIELKPEYLDGLALVDEDLTKGKTIRYLSVEDLPEDEFERLQLLFNFRSQWNFEEIRPFLSDICPTTRDLNELIARRCRVANIREQKIILGMK